jgi:hypothetical protein
VAAIETRRGSGEAGGAQEHSGFSEVACAEEGARMYVWRVGSRAPRGIGHTGGPSRANGLPLSRRNGSGPYNGTVSLFHLGYGEELLQ